MHLSFQHMSLLCNSFLSAYILGFGLHTRQTDGPITQYNHRDGWYITNNSMDLLADLFPWRAKRSEGVSMLMIGDSLSRYTLEDLDWLAFKENWTSFDTIHYDHHRVAVRLEHLEAVRSHAFLASKSHSTRKLLCMAPAYIANKVQEAIV